MFVKHDLFAVLCCPTTTVRDCTFGTVTAAQFGIFTSRRAAVSVTNMSLGEVVWINHFNVVPTAEDNVEVLRQFTNDIDMAVYNVILLL